MGVYNLPAEISYITKMKNGNLTYIEHSMGTTRFFVMAIDRPDIAANVNAMFSLAPVAFMTDLKSPVRLLTPFLRELETLMPMILSHSPAGASTKTIVHYGQEINAGRFQRYVYGSRGNIKKYNGTVPPEYDLSKVQVPAGVFWAENDWLAIPIDVKILYGLLRKKIISYKINYPKFNHLDFLWAVDVPKLVFKELLTVMEEYR